MNLFSGGETTQGGRRFSLMLVIPFVVLAMAGTVVWAARADSADPPPQVSWTAGPSLMRDWQKRWDPAVAYHPPTDKVVMFGGSPATTDGAWFNDTWIMKNETWRRGPVSPAGLTARGGAALAYHPPTGDLVLFGGAGTAWPPSNETWLFNGNWWRRGPAAPAGLEGRVGAQMAYHPPSGNLVLFGGSSESGLLETWFFNGTRWTEGPAPATGMPPHAFGGFTYDERIGQMVLVGGSGSRATWYFNGTRWTSGPTLPAALGAKERIDAEFHRGFGRTVIFGGLGPGENSDELWMLDRGNVWRRLDPAAAAPRPDARLDGHLVWVDGRQELLLVSGVCCFGSGRTVFRDTWWLS